MSASAATLPTPSSGAWSDQLASLAESSLHWGVRVVGAVSILVIAWIFAAWARRTLQRMLSRPRLDATLVHFVSNLARWVILILALVACLSAFGVDTTSLVAVLGAAGLAVGLAVQGSLANLAAGIMLLVLRPFRLGDFVSLAGSMGTVKEVDLFHTHIDTPDNRRVILPNGQVFGGPIENITRHPVRRIDLSVGVAYAADVDRTREVLRRAITSVSAIRSEPSPEAALVGLGASSVDWALRVWVATEEFGAARDSLIRAIKHHLDDAGIGIPFPQMQVWMSREESKP